MPRIAMAGFQHETNSFATTIAGMAEFEMADAWPPLLTGADVISGTDGMNLPIAGFAKAARAHPGIELIPILWASAEPSGPVTAEAFDTIAGRILDGIRTAAPLDGLYLDLHGAMITEQAFDGEAALLGLIREVTGPDLPIAISLDLHANVTAAMVEHATSIAIFRTYPHLDMAETGARALHRLLSHIAGERPAKALRQAPYLIPLHAQFTGAGPARELYARIADTDGAELAMGFTGSDMPDAGPSVLVHAGDQDTADRMADDLLAALLDAEAAFEGLPPSADEAVRDALSRPRGMPVVIADVEDNAGGGGSSDTTGLLRALIDAGADGAILALVNDPEAAALAHAAGPGGVIETGLGGRSGCSGDAPLEGRFEVMGLSDGTVPFEGEVYRGGTAQIGPTACLRVLGTPGDIRVVVGSVRNQCLDRAYFRHIGLTPEDARIICVKSTVHFRADFDPIAQATILASVPGALASDLAGAPYKYLRPGVRLGPDGPQYRPIMARGAAQRPLRGALNP
jgi:microcystin degradation protein MlrC